MSRDVLVNALSEPGGLVRLFGRDGELEVEGFDGFWLRVEDVAKLPTSWQHLVGEPDRGHVRVRWPEDSGRGGSRGRLRHYREHVFEPRGIDALEADVDPAQRFLIEHPEVKTAEDWRLLWYDLETERVANWDRPWEGRILSFSWANSDGRRGHVRAEARTDEAERRLLETFVRLADRHDVLLAWNGSRFDDRVIRGRCVELDVPFDGRLNHWLDHLKLFKRYFLKSEDGAVTQSFALDSIAAAFLGSERKVPVEERARALGYDGSTDLFVWVWEKAPALLREYNDQDVELCRKLEAKTGFVALHLGLCRLCRVLPNSSSLYPTTLVDGRMMQRGQQVGRHFPTRWGGEDGGQQRARGAYVPEAKVGLHESVAVVDYARMYPSIILSWNMSLETLSADGSARVPETTPTGRETGEVVARFRTEEEGDLPAALRGVLEERKRYSQAKDAAEIGSPAWHDAGRLSTACKVLANTFYGVILSPFSRYHRHEIGESVTSIGRLLLAKTIEEVERRQHRRVFGDTDSVAFIASDDEAAAVRDEVNARVVPALVEKWGGRPGHVRLEYEKRFRRVVVTASKRYAGLFAVYGGKPARPDAGVDVRGLEIVRSDVCKAARALQREALEWILRPAEVPSPTELWEWVERFRADLVAGKVDVADLVLRKAMTKRPDEYATKPVQVRVAEEMMARGMEVHEGSKIAFLHTRGGGAIIPDDLLEVGELDLGLYWNQHIFPATQRVLAAAFPEVEWGGLLFTRGTDPGQIGLFAGEGPRAAAKRKLAGVSKPSEPPPAPASEPPTPAAPAAGRRVRKVARPPALRLTVRAERAPETALRVKELLAMHAGPHPVEVRVELHELGAVVDLEVPETAADPATAPMLSSALRTLGWRWSVGR